MSRYQRDYEQESAEAIERLRHSVKFARAGLQALILINIAALIGLFILAVPGHAVRFSHGQIWISFAALAIGQIFNLLAFLAAHLSQDDLYKVAQFQAWNAGLKLDGQSASYDVTVLHRRGSIEQYVAMAFAVLSLLAFIGGCGWALASITAG